MPQKTMTERALAANRANAQLSTGPRTPQGKALVSRNALTHGIFAQDVIPRELEVYESRADFDDLLAALEDDLQPADGVERMLVESIATSTWRLRRVYRTEAGFIGRRRDLMSRAGAFGEPAPPPALAALERGLAADPPDFPGLRALLAPPDSGREGYSDDAILDIAHATIAGLRAQHAAQVARWRSLMSLQCALPATDTASRLGRYAGDLQRAIVALLKELRDRRAARQQPGTPSFADLDGSWAAEEET